MSETETSSGSGEELLTELRLRAEGLEQRIADLQKDSDARVIRAELKAEAVRAGMIDLDGLKLVDAASLRLNEKGDVEGATQLMTQLKRAKPWLFGTASTSSAAVAPTAQPPRQKRATEMTDEEYREARAAVLRGHR